jgi:hypothetical protein
MKRFLITIAIFVGFITLLALLSSAPALVEILRALSRGDHVIFGNPKWGSDGHPLASILLSALILLLSLVFSYWLSGHFLKLRKKRMEDLNPQ